MESYPKIDIHPEMSDDTIRELCLLNPHNGPYAKFICRRCGCFGFDKDGDVRTAKIVNCCEECYREYVEILEKEIQVYKRTIEEIKREKSQ